jgi:hypothetical protein
MIRVHFATFGAKLPKALVDELSVLEQRHDRDIEAAARVILARPFLFFVTTASVRCPFRLKGSACLRSRRGSCSSPWGQLWAGSRHWPGYDRVLPGREGAPVDIQVPRLRGTDVRKAGCKVFASRADATQETRQPIVAKSSI